MHPARAFLGWRHVMTVATLCVATVGASSSAAQHAMADLIHACADTSLSAQDIVAKATQEHGFGPTDVSPATLHMARRDEGILSVLSDMTDAQQIGYLTEVYPAQMRNAQAATRYGAREDMENSVLEDENGTILNVWSLPSDDIVGCLFFTFAPNAPMPVALDFARQRIYSTAYGSIESYFQAESVAPIVHRCALPTSALNPFFAGRPQTTSVLLISTKRPPASS